MPEYITIDGARIPVPTVEELPDKTPTNRLSGRLTKKSLNAFVYDLLSTNEVRFRLLLKTFGKTAFLSPDHDLPVAVKISGESLNKPAPFNDDQLEAAIRTEFAGYPTVLEAFDNGTYRIAEYRSRYRNGTLVKGIQPRYATFAYNQGVPVDRSGGHSRPLSPEEFKAIVVDYPDDPANQMKF